MNDNAISLLLKQQILADQWRKKLWDLRFCPYDFEMNQAVSRESVETE